VYCTSRARPGITLKHGRIRVIFHATLNVGICYATVFDAQHCGIMHDQYLPTCALRGRADGSVLQDGLISYLIRHIVMYVLTDEAITQRGTLLLLQRLLPIGLA